MPTKLFLKPFCAHYTTKLTSNLKWHDSTTGYLQLQLIGQFPTYMKVELPHQVKTRGCLLAVFKENPAELAITPELAITSETSTASSCLSERDDVSQKVWSSFITSKYKGAYP